MRALTVTPQKKDSLDVVDMPEPDPKDGDVLVQGLALGVCGTDHEISEGLYGWAPGGADRLILGHESLGQVLEAPQDSGFAEGDLIVGVVRLPDPEPCGACAHDEWDMCRNGKYTEHGIKEIHGFGSEQWRVHAKFATRLDAGLKDVGMLLEPTTVVAKAWEQVDRIGDRAWFEPKSVLVTGAGPIGLLGALIGVQRGLDVHVLDRAKDGLKPELVKELGATYHADAADEVMKKVKPDVVIEGTGAVPVIQAVLAQNVPYGIVVLTGISNPGDEIPFDLGAVNRDLVLDNGAVVGSVNANLRHYEAGAQVLKEADNAWLERLITRRVPLEKFADAFAKQDDDVKVVLTLS
ncbi:glucose 1-dehydrogenase [Luteipulveratus halotolerans]|uniref:Theronine dehydrogenase n=1 Tax=Luteipulveratus halotolerans TaxID=1631356 RepID=A0A0L6CHP2_9MICO|nr:glucose 1-dehydrogenase [Luteipulveratus halotolerans]KNX37033.1 theronine dehydrogenase [Luteipulveratus halotolerans]